MPWSKPRQNQKPKKNKTFWRRFDFRFKHVFFCFPRVFCLDFGKPKKNAWLFLVLKEFLLGVSKCEQMPQKIRPEFFWFFALLQVRITSNNKNLRFLFVLKNENKKSRNAKKNIFGPETKTSPYFFWFSRGLGRRIRICGVVMSGPYLILVAQLLCFPFLWSYSKEESYQKTGVWLKWKDPT